ncbi:DUF1697 domain-containing protein [Sagittula sp. S175]|uniref:DUF1697 domain-containing protein n=1 Tax=Sagittula sp. S175 TaxID=3415129 RepID=UPI003C7A1425
MRHYAVFLRAVNVGGTGKLRMDDLLKMASAIGGTAPKTHGVSGNLVLSTDDSAEQVQMTLEEQLLAYARKPVGVLVRTLPQLDALIAANPFPEANPSFLICLLTDEDIPDPLLPEARHHRTELIAPGPGAIYLHYPDGQGRSRLILPQMKSGTARNMNTIRKMRDLLAVRR